MRKIPIKIKPACRQAGNYNEMNTVIIELTSPKTMKLILDLEELDLLRVIKKDETADIIAVAILSRNRALSLFGSVIERFMN